MKKLLSLLLCSLMVLSVTQNVVHAEEKTANSKTTIPDDQIIKNDEKGIPDSILYNNALRWGDSNGDAILTKEEALQIVEMEYLAPAKSTISLKGLSHLKNVSMFGYGEGGGYQFYENKHITLTDQEELLKLPKLEYLSFTYADNVDLLVISQLKKVSELSVWCSSFTDNSKLSNLSSMKSLRTLEIRFQNNGLTAYDLDLISACQQLTDLDLWGNKISTIKPLSKMENLLSLRIWDNLVKDCNPVLSLTNLKKLDIQENLIMRLPNLKALGNLEELSIGGNYLTRDDVLAKVDSKFTSNEEFMKNALKQRAEAPDTEDVKDPIINKDNLDQPYDKVLDAIPNNFVDKIYNAKEGVVVSLSSGLEINPKIFEVAIKEKKSLLFEVVNDSGEVEYSWTFNGNDSSQQIDAPLNLSLNFNSDKKSEIEKITNQKDAFYLNFKHHGELPMGTARIKVKVDNKYKNGDKIFLYFFNEEKNTVESIDNFALVVKDGYVEFDIHHCSTYFLTPTKIGENETKEPTQTVKPVQTADETTVVYLVGLISLGLIGMCVARKKENN